MQTFLPYQSFIETASCLDMRRLGKQRVETKQILIALSDPTYGWQNHPAVKMWKGYESTLAYYGYTICYEWKLQGYKDEQLDWFDDQLWNRIHKIGLVLNQSDLPIPHWLNDQFCISHRSNLIRKLPSHYGKLWPDIPNNLQYIWPQ